MCAVNGDLYAIGGFDGAVGLHTAEVGSFIHFTAEYTTEFESSVTNTYSAFNTFVAMLRYKVFIFIVHS